MAKARDKVLVRDPTTLPANSRRSKIRKLLMKGWTSTEIANKLAPDSPRKRKTIRGEVRHVISHDEEYQAFQVAIANGGILEEWPEITDAVVRRARRGRVDAAKFLAEVSGIHNPRVDHRHTGDVKLTLTALPRPEPSKLDSPPPDVIEGNAREVA